LTLTKVTAPGGGGVDEGELDGVTEGVGEWLGVLDGVPEGVGSTGTAPASVHALGGAFRGSSKSTSTLTLEATKSTPKPKSHVVHPLSPVIKIEPA